MENKNESLKIVLVILALFVIVGIIDSKQKSSSYINCSGDNQTANCCLKKCKALEYNIPLWGNCFDGCMGGELKTKKSTFKA